MYYNEPPPLSFSSPPKSNGRIEVNGSKLNYSNSSPPSQIKKPKQRCQQFLKHYFNIQCTYSE